MISQQGMLLENQSWVKVGSEAAGMLDVSMIFAQLNFNCSPRYLGWRCSSSRKEAFDGEGLYWRKVLMMPSDAALSNGPAKELSPSPK
jgi:hypothetical protein